MSESRAKPQWSADGQWWWDGEKWLPASTMSSGHTTQASAQPMTRQSAQQVQGETKPATTASPSSLGNNMPPASRIRSYSPDGRFWWDGTQWLPYRRITWNSLHLRSNPPEDRATLSRNLGIWCATFGTVAIVGLVVGAFSLLAAIAGPVALYHGITFHRDNARLGGTLPGSAKATLGIVLSSIGIVEFILALALRVAIPATH